MASSSSSSNPQNEEHHAFSGIEPPGIRSKASESSRLFDVFINHRGPDVKETLARQLYNSLQELGIQAFLDSEEKQLGDSFPSAIETAIRSASVHIAIFSKRYAESAWCLAELVLMIQSKAKIIPVFYGVKPLELRYIEKGAYAEAFVEYERKSRYIDKLEEWKEALHSISYATGSEFYNSDVCDCKDIVSAVQKEVLRTKSLYVAKYPVGLHKILQDFENKCLTSNSNYILSALQLLALAFLEGNREGKAKEKEKEKAKVVGIFGLGGSGKTTLCKELYNRKRLEYSRSCFLFDVREASSKGEFVSLQIKLIKDLFNDNAPNFQSVEEGTSCIKNRLERSIFLSFLIILDDIDHVEQLDALLVMDVLKNAGNSLVIVTTRDEGVLKSARITITYNLTGMNRDFARELFCWHAFDQPHPTSGYEDTVDDFIDVCGGLPLSVQVFGRHVCGRDRAYWCLELDKARKTLPEDIRKRLEISFNALDSGEKQMFMDIACFFVNKAKHIALSVWKGCGWGHAEHALQTLKDKCLVQERHPSHKFYCMDDDECFLQMHDHIRDLGREMAQEMSDPTRLWRPQILKSLESEGFKTILSQVNVRCFQSIRDRTMNANITYFIGNLEEDWAGASASLLWLELNFNGDTPSSIPVWIPLQNLKYLRINNGHLKRLWQSDIEVPSSLKELYIAGTIFKEIPDLSRMSNHLEKIFIKAEARMSSFEGWSLLESFIIKPRSLVLQSSTLRVETAFNNRRESAVFGSSPCVELSNIKLEGILTLNNRGQCPSVKPSISSLEKLDISYQDLVTKVFVSGYHYPNLEYLNLCSMQNLTELDLKMVTRLHSLQLNDCTNLKSVSGIGDLTSLIYLNIRKCSQLEELPCLSHLNCLQSVEIYKCWKLNCLELDGCTNLKSVDFFRVPHLGVFSVRHCPQLEKLPHFLDIWSLKKVMVDGCGKFNRLELSYCENLRSLSGNLHLTQLKIIECPRLEEVPSLAGVENLTIIKCEKLQNITLPKTLTYLKVEGQTEWKTVPGLSHLTKLVKLTITECPELKELRSVSRLRFLENLKIERCPKLHNIVGIEELLALKDMEFSLCSNAALRNSIHMLKGLPSEYMTAVGSAVDGAESILSPDLFSEWIEAEAVIEIDVHDKSPHIFDKWLLYGVEEEDNSCVAAGLLDLSDSMLEQGSVSAITVCALVAVHKSSSTECLRMSLRNYGFGLYLNRRSQLCNGEWIFSTVITHQELINQYIACSEFYHPTIRLEWAYEDEDEENIFHVGSAGGAIKKVYVVAVKKGEEWKTLNVMKIISDRLLQK